MTLLSESKSVSINQVPWSLQYRVNLDLITKNNTRRSSQVQMQDFSHRVNEIENEKEKHNQIVENYNKYCSCKLNCLFARNQVNRLKMKNKFLLRPFRNLATVVAFFRSYSVEETFIFEKEAFVLFGCCRIRRVAQFESDTTDLISKSGNAR